MKMFKDHLVEMNSEDFAQFKHDNSKLVINFDKKVSFLFNEHEYDVTTIREIKETLRSLKENCLDVGLSNLSEMFFLIDNLFDAKINLKEHINKSEYELMQLIKHHFNNILNALENNRQETVQTPILEILKRLNAATDRKNNLSTRFIQDNQDELIDADIEIHEDKSETETEIQTDNANLITNEDVSDIEAKKEVMPMDFGESAESSESIEPTDLLDSNVNDNYDIKDEQNESTAESSEANNTSNDMEIFDDGLQHYSDLNPSDQIDDDLYEENNQEDNLYALLDEAFLEQEQSILSSATINDNDNNTDTINPSDVENVSAEHVLENDITMASNEYDNTVPNENHLNNNSNVENISQQKEIVYIEKPTTTIYGSNGAILFDSERNGFIINNMRFIPANEWGAFCNNISNNINQLFNYNNALIDDFNNSNGGYDLYFDTEVSLPYINGIINDCEKVGLFKTSALFLKLKFFLIFLEDNEIKYSYDIDNIVRKTILAANNLILSNNQEYQYESYDHIFLFIDEIHSYYSAQIYQFKLTELKIDIVNNMHEIMNKHLKEMGDKINDNSTSLSNLEKSFSKYSMRVNDYLNSINSHTQKTNENVSNIAEIILSNHVDLEKNMTGIYNNQNNILNKLLRIEAEMHDNNNGILKGLFKK